MFSKEWLDVNKVINIIKIFSACAMFIIIGLIIPGVCMSNLIHMPFMPSLFLWSIMLTVICISFISILSLKYASKKEYKRFILGRVGKYIYCAINFASVVLSIYYGIVFYYNIPILYGSSKLLIYCLKTLIPMTIGAIFARYASKLLCRYRRVKYR